MTSLESLVPYHSYDPDGRVFVMKDGSLGVAWQLSAFESEAMSETQLGELAARVDALLRLVPAGAAVQFLWRADRDVRRPLERWRRATTRDGLYADLADSRVRALERASFTHDGATVVARVIRLHLTMRVFPAYDRRGIEGSYAKHKRELLDRVNAIESLLAQQAVPFARHDADALLAVAFAWLNVSGEPPRDRDDRLLCERVARTSIEIDGGTVTVGGIAHRMLSAIEVPRETWAGMLTRGDGATPLDLVPECALVFNVAARDPEEVRKFLAAKKRLAFCQQSGGDGRADIAAIKTEVDDVLGQMYTDGARPYSARIHLVTRGDPSSAANAIGRTGLELVEEDALAGTLWLQSLPLGYDPSNDRAIKRGRTMLGLNLAHLLPVYGAYRGTSRPDLLLMNRRGEPVTFSFFDSEVAPHGIVAGVSGSGKSVFANAMILSAGRRGGHVFVLDRGDSYRKLCELAGGTYVAFDPERPQSINPCGRGLSPEKLIFLTDIVAEMCTQGQRELTVKERALVGRAVQRAFSGADREILASDLRDALAADADPSSKELAVCLEPFCGDGPYAGFFDRPCAVDLDRPLTVFELGEIAKRRDVASAILMALIHNITGFCARHVPLEKYLVVDEAWTLLRTANTAQFLEDVLRTYRKLNCAAVMVTQQVSDFEGRAGEAIRANAPNRVFLRQTPETVQAMERLLDLSPEDKRLLAGLTTVKGRFSEMLIVSTAGKGVARLVPDPLLYWVATSDPADNERLGAKIRACDGDVRRALREITEGGERAESTEGNHGDTETRRC